MDQLKQVVALDDSLICYRNWRAENEEGMTLEEWNEY